MVEVGAEVLEGKLVKLSGIEKALAGDGFFLNLGLSLTLAYSVGGAAGVLSYKLVPSTEFAIFLGALWALGSGIALSRYFTRRQKPYVEVLDELLADYDPIDELAYNKLQRDARGGLAPAISNIREWVATERGAIRALLPIPQGPGTKFINKKK